MKFDTEFAYNIICPHCFYEDRDSWECGMGDGDHDIKYCGKCDKQFEVYCEISRTFSTKKIKKES